MGEAIEHLTKASWAALALIHLPPAAVLFAPGLVRRLYAIDPAGDLGVLLTHRGALFAAMVVLCGFALIDPAIRRASSVVVAVSVVGFLILYVRAGAPVGALRTIAIVDAVAVMPLLLVLIAAWRPHTA